jgi:hypothetical protein
VGFQIQNANQDYFLLNCEVALKADYKTMTLFPFCQYMPAGQDGKVWANARRF